MVKQETILNTMYR